MTLFSFLKKSRVLIGISFFLLTLALFIDLYEKIEPGYYNGILYMQFIPSLLKFIQTLSLSAAGGFIIVLILTFATGRLYCSTICPLGIYQDIISWFAKKLSKKKIFYKFKPGKKIVKYSLLTLFTIALLTGSAFIVLWLDPYSIIGRFFSFVIEPIAAAINNTVATIAQRYDNYNFYHVTVHHVSWLPLSITLAIMITIGILAYKRGRLFCNLICPVGTFLGEASKLSLLKVKFNSNNCTKCGKCAAVCKSECIDIKNQSIDIERCVTCFNCLQSCPDGAMLFGPFKTTPHNNNPGIEKSKPQKEEVHNKDRRKLVTTAIVLLTSAKVYSLKKNQLPESQQNLTRNKIEYYPSPPGSKSIKRFNSICTSCALCVSACPTKVLQPSITEYGLKGFMQPYMDFSTNYCNFECHECSDVCPTGAILPLPLEEKKRTQLGKVVFLKENCIVYTDNTDCGACSEHCPTKAVDMVPYRDGLLIPEVNVDICIGCGACEYPCPVPYPFRAIYVNGNSEHILADPPDEGEAQIYEPEEDFPF
ncbi:4Fe-4S dicluster domain-containing protein [Marinilabiliaceae bacterium ANBcel2]|nr:4Fe-4S dicluster domain-containing protein [Marinilabiliaceae bacterium ANBcel2]